MAMLVTDPYTEERLKAEREASGADRYDEVWDGVYLMTPLPNNEHQRIVLRLSQILQTTLGPDVAANIFAGVNVSDREVDWVHNYRAPDVAAYLPNTEAKDCDTHWCGGADFAVEIVSPGDHSREKLDFYAKVGTRELLIVDRDPWKLELYRLQGGQLRLISETSVTSTHSIESLVVPLSFGLLPGETRPRIEVHASVKAVCGDNRWLI